MEKEVDIDLLDHEELRDASSQKVEMATESDLLLLGNWYVQSGMYSMAVESYKRVAEIEPNFAGVYYNLGFAYYKNGDFDEAKHEIKKAISLQPDNANFHYLLGLLLDDEYKFREALESFSKAISLNEKHLEALYYRGMLYDKLEELQKAYEDFSTILHLQNVPKPLFVDTLHNLGVIQMKLKLWREAEKTFEQYLNADKYDADAHYHLGEIYLCCSKDIQRAIDSFQNAIQLAPIHLDAQYALPIHLDARYALALSYAKCRYSHPDVRTEYRQKAIDQLTELISINHEFHTFERLHEAFFLLGSLYDDEPDDADEAIDAYKLGLDYAESPEARNNLGVLYSQKGMLNDAVGEFRQAIQSNPDYESPYHNLAKLYLHERDSQILGNLVSWLNGVFDDADTILHNLSLALVDVAKSEAYQSIYSNLHSIKNLVGLSGAKLRRATRMCHDRPELYELLMDIFGEQEKYYNEMVALLQNLKQEELVIELVNINKALKSVLNRAMSNLSAKNIKCQTNFDDALPHVKADINQLKEAFANLVVNAIDAMEAGGTLKITTEYERSGVKIIFADTGVGIPREELVNVFKPGYSLKEHGSGFGLNIVQRTVRKHRGKMELNSEQGSGTTITIHLPVDFESAPIQSNLQMRQIFYEAPHDLVADELA